MAKRPGAGGIILLAVVLGLVTAYLIWAKFREMDKDKEANWKPVVVALVDIEARQKVTEDKIELVKTPPTHHVPGVLTNRADAVGRLARTRIQARDQVRDTDVVKEGEVPGLSFSIPPGHRAIAIAVDEVKGAGNTIQPGDHVDILTTYTDPILKQEVTKIILQNIKILAVDKGRTDPNTGAGATTSITMALRPEDTELVKAAERAGVLQVALRPVEPEPASDTAGVRISDILPGLRAVEPATPGPGDGRATPVIISPPARAPRAEIKIYRATTETVVPSSQ